MADDEPEQTTRTGTATAPAPYQPQRDRPSLPIRSRYEPATNAPTPVRPNPFAAIEVAGKELAEFHERLKTLVARLAGEPPKLGEAAGGVDSDIGHSGLLGLSASVAQVMSKRVQHMQTLADRLDEFLQ